MTTTLSTILSDHYAPLRQFTMTMTIIVDRIDEFERLTILVMTCARQGNSRALVR